MIVNFQKVYCELTEITHVKEIAQGLSTQVLASFVDNSNKNKPQLWECL